MHIADRRRNSDGSYEYLVEWDSKQMMWMTYNHIYTHCLNKIEMEVMRSEWIMKNGSGKDDGDDEQLFQHDELQRMKQIKHYHRIEISEHDDRYKDEDDDGESAIVI